MTYPRFHLALPVTDLEAAAHFYGELLGCTRGRESSRWVDFDFWGHQLVIQLVPEEAMAAAATNPVDGEKVPASHFGPILDWDAFDTLADRLTSAGVDFIIPPRVRFEGRPGEQATMFFLDPSGNALEFKAFRDDAQVFAT